MGHARSDWLVLGAGILLACLLALSFDLAGDAVPWRAWDQGAWLISLGAPLVVFAAAGAWLSLRRWRDFQQIQRRLSESEELARRRLNELENIYRTSPVGMALVDLDSRFLRVNDRLAAMNGLPAPEHIGRSALEIIPDVARRLNPVFRRVVEQGEWVEGIEVHAPLPTEPDVERDWLVSCYPIHAADGRVIAMSTLVQDITDRKRAEAALRESHGALEHRVAQRSAELSAVKGQLEQEIDQRERAEESVRQSERLVQEILDNTKAVVYVKDPDGRYRLINHQFEELFSISREQIRGRTDHEVFPKAIADAFRTNDLEVLRRREAIEFDEIAPHADGPHDYISLKFPLLSDDGMPIALCGVSTDITDRKRAEEQLRAQQRFLKRLLAVHERDRQLLAGEIHDGTVQPIIAALMHLDAARSKQPCDAERAEEEYQTAIELLRKTVDLGRWLMSGLRPPNIDEQGIVPAIRYLINGQAASSGLDVEFVHDLQVERFDPLLEMTVFRIVQEALANVAQHSGTTDTRVTLVQQDDRIRVEVQDWGAGLDPSAITEHRYGLRTIRDRAALFDGRLEIDSAPGQGTRVSAELPLIAPVEGGPSSCG